MKTIRLNPKIIVVAENARSISSATRTAILKASALFLIFIISGSLSLMAEGEHSNLIDVKWLEQNLKNSDVIILDASPAPIYASKHIPGAISVDIYSWYGLRELPKADMEKIYQSWGVSTGKKIVMYDQGGTILATRLFYSFYYHGFPVKDLLILDGGLFKWQEAGLPVTNEVVQVEKKGSFTITRTNEVIKSELPEFITASGDPANNVLLDALSPDWHFGEVVTFNKAGHVPNSIMVSATDFFKPDKTFKSTDEIKKMLDYFGIRPDQTVYTHCGGGVAASVPFFAVKFLAGYPKVKLYKESQLGWLSDDRDLPFWTYDAPSLMRETSWLQFWGGRMIRMFGGAKVSIVDIRPVNEFYQGHVPFALNIPANIFKNNLKDPQKMAEILGRSGVNSTLEAVVISGGMLTREAALAILVLKDLGQNRVSVFMDPLDKWEKPGFTLTKDSTVTGNKATNPLSIPVMSYPGNLRRNVIITNLMSVSGSFPRVIIASGKEIPTIFKGDKVIHVPYTTLINADGTPKAAKDIWKILAGAGVPRYAELVCYSDDPGESAVTYFILMLMGFPHVNVLVN